MAKNLRIGIIRARHDTSVPLISDAVCTEMFMTGEHSVFRYWRNTTRNHLDFLDSALFPWVDMTLGADTSRTKQAEAAVAALRAKFPRQDPLAGFDALVVLTLPGTRSMPNPQAALPGQPATITTGFDGGTTGVAGLSVAVLPVMTSNHTFMCHEVGHTIGFDHSFGLDNNGTDWNPADANIIVGPEYGSPYDMMSAGSFGSRWLGTGPLYSAAPTFVGPVVAGWPNTGAFTMGPHIARATLHLYMPEALAGRVLERPFPPPGGAIRCRLVPASATQGTCLLILHPPDEPANGAGRVYVEFRTRKGWDLGLDPVGPSLSREGVVVHTLVDQPNAGLRTWYRGSIPTVSADRDVVVPTTPLVVHVEDTDSNGDWVEVSVSLGAARDVHIVRGLKNDDMVGVVGPTEEFTSPCNEVIRKGTFATSTMTQFGVSLTGFGGDGQPAATPPTVTWTVGGVTAVAPGGSLNVPFDGATFAVEYSIDPVVFELQLTSRGGERYDVPVVVTVSDAGGTGTANTTFNSLGWFDGIHPEDIDKLGSCLGRIADRYHVVPPVFRKPTPEPTWNVLERHRAELRWFDHATRLIRTLPGLDVGGRSVLTQLVQLQMHPVPSTLDSLLAGGIDFSVPEADLRNWLNNAYTPYPALAEALLRLLNGRSLTKTHQALPRHARWTM